MMVGHIGVRGAAQNTITELPIVISFAFLNAIPRPIKTNAQPQNIIKLMNREIKPLTVLKDLINPFNQVQNLLYNLTTFFIF